MTAVAISNALYTKLVADQTAGSLYAAVEGRIHLGEAPHVDATTPPIIPCLVYNIIGDEQLRSFGGVMTHGVTVQFDLYGKATVGMSNAGGTGIGDIESKLFSLLEGAALAPTGFDRGLVTFTNRFVTSVDGDAIRIVDQAEITGTDF